MALTEGNWLAFNNPYEALNAVPGGVSQRKLRLLAVACCRRIWGLLPDHECRHVVEFAERLADGEGGEAERAWLQTRMARVTAEYYHEAATPGSRASARFVASVAASRAAGPPPRRGRLPSGGAISCADTWVSAAAATFDPAGHPPLSNEGLTVGLIGRLPEARAQCELVRDIVGGPAQQGPPPPCCRTPTARALARAAYEDRSLPAGHLDPVCLGVLSDALEEEGCEDDELLSHLRSPGPHVRGCWAVDLVLGK